MDSPRADLIRASTVIIWDELPGANVSTFDCADSICQQLMNSRYPFGGIPFIGVGDFRQVAPVVKNSGPSACLSSSVKSSVIWPQFIHFTLSTPIRSAYDEDFTNFVDKIGENCGQRATSMNMFRIITNVDEAIRFLYPATILANPFECLKHAFLSPRNLFVNEFNETT